MIKRYGLKSTLLFLLILSSNNLVFAKALVSIKVTPEHVGVFTSVGKQQFTATGVFSDGSEQDYTTKVSWSLSGSAFSGQTLKPSSIATINQKGLATIKSTWGRVRVNATYPPVAVARTIPTNIINGLLLRPQLSTLPTMNIINSFLLLREEDKRYKTLSVQAPPVNIIPLLSKAEKH